MDAGEVCVTTLYAVALCFLINHVHWQVWSGTWRSGGLLSKSR